MLSPSTFEDTTSLLRRSTVRCSRVSGSVRYACLLTRSPTRPQRLSTVNGTTPTSAQSGEMLLVRGVSRDLFEGTSGSPGLRDVFSVYGRDATVNVNTASAAVFQVLLGIDAREAAAVMADRARTPSDMLMRLRARYPRAD